MDNLLTSQQVEELLKVNRITVYRMLRDGRLKGVKIGQHWRFPANQFDKLLAGNHLKSEFSSAESAKKPNFPTHCVQTIQELFAGVSDIEAIILDKNGIPLTEPSICSSYLNTVYQNPLGRNLIEQSWKNIVHDSRWRGWFLNELGLWSFKIPFSDEGEVGGFGLIGNFAATNLNMGEKLSYIAGLCNLDLATVQTDYREITLYDEVNRGQIETWAVQFIRAVEGILQERSGLINRLHQIVQLGTV